jgi:hypothetical protein
VSGFFKFRKWEEKAGLSPLMECIGNADSCFQFGERGLIKQIGGERLYPKRLYPERASADIELNSKAFDALRNLSERWNVN